MIRLLLAGLGGFLGSAARYSVGVALARSASAVVFPVATLVVNVVGSFLIGFVIGHGMLRGWLSADVRVFLVAGVLGGFTTFSAFSYETLTLFREAGAARALLNVFLTLTLCLLGVWLGDVTGRMVAR